MNMNKIIFQCLTILSIIFCVACTNTIDNTLDLQRKTAPCDSIPPTDVAVDDDNTIYSALEYYAYYGDELKANQPYTYIMNKYLDLALDYMGEWNIEITGRDIESKKRLFIESSIMHFDEEYLEDMDLEGSDEDIFFNMLYEQLAEELNTFPIIDQYLGENEVDDYEDIILPFKGGIGYSKIDILYHQENEIPLEHEQYNTDDYYEDNECGCWKAPAQSQTQSKPQPQRLVRYDLISKWLTDIRYRNYKETCPMGIMREAMDEWEEAANHAIHFVEIKDNGWNRFRWGIGCHYHVCLSNNNCFDGSCGTSSLGAVPWAYIHITCNNKGTCLHELGHTLSLKHEQCRPDRDCYINVEFSNINASWKSQYKKELESSVTAYGPFDFESIMLYGSRNSSAAVDENNLVVMTRKDGSEFAAQRDSLSEGDKLYIRNIYY